MSAETEISPAPGGRAESGVGTPQTGHGPSAAHLVRIAAHGALSAAFLLREKGERFFDPRAIEQLELGC